MPLFRFSVETQRQAEMIDLTPEVEKRVRESGVVEGICLVYSPHTTAAVTVNEAADPDVRFDILMETDKIVPRMDGYRHAEGNSAAHIKTSLFGCSALIPVEKGRLALGTWQAVYFCEFDGPRRRTCIVRVMSEAPGGWGAPDLDA